ncbi:t-SNARE domain-containing protein 1 [Athalia rosae]|uniref:t-SNARE domain-containing protein 1 n=1 Tax=Athalia rosae TaxID=37344 RepID=UPI002033E8B1|nr:t-SNARE domain-containing protein 1 [Athalia rosae]
MAHTSRGYGSTDQRSDIPDVGFSPTELYSLSENITTNIYTINSSWRTLDRAFKTIGTNKDSQGLRDKVHVTQHSTNQVVTQTSKDIARLTVLMRRGDKEQKLQIEKLTTDFKEAFLRYSDMQKAFAEKMKRYLLVSSNNSENQSADGSQDTDTLVQIQEDNERREVQRSLEFDQGLLLEREERIRRIEGDILDANQIMRELGALVNQQADSINTIENSIENVHGNVELGAQELVKANSYQSKFRRKVCFLLLLAVIAVVILTIILVTKLS